LAAFIINTSDVLLNPGELVASKHCADMRVTLQSHSASRARSATPEAGRRSSRLLIRPHSKGTPIVNLRMIVKNSCSPPLGCVLTDGRRGFQQRQG
jgi:hypothetical protein